MPVANDPLTNMLITDSYNQNILSLIKNKKSKMRLYVFDAGLKKRVFLELQYNPESLQISLQDTTNETADRSTNSQYADDPASADMTNVHTYMTSVSMQTIFENVVSDPSKTHDGLNTIEEKLNWLLKYQKNVFLVFLGPGRIYKGALATSSWNIQKFYPDFRYAVVKVNLSWIFFDKMDETTVDTYNATSTFGEDLKSGKQKDIKNKIDFGNNVLTNCHSTTGSLTKSDTSKATVFSNLSNLLNDSISEVFSKIDPKTGKLK